MVMTIAVVQIREIRAADRAFAEWYAVHESAVRADDPGGPRWRARELRELHQPHEHRDSVLWLAEDDGRPVGAAVLGLPLADNLHLAEPEIFVRPDARRREVGTSLLDVVEAAAKARGRTSMLTFVSGTADDHETPGTRFARQHGFTERITEVRRVQRPPFRFDDIQRAVTEAKGRAAGYEIVTWRDRVSPQLVDEFARLEARLSTDAPLGDMEYEGEVWDEARIRAAEDRYIRMGRGSWSAAAMAPDGSMAGVTRISIPLDTDADGFQDTTIVDPDHRGHRLGLLLKAANLASILDDRPGIRRIWTWNAESNAHMIAVNEMLGYRVEGWGRGYQRSIRGA